MAWAFDKINAYVNRLVRKEIYSKQLVARPLFYFLTMHAQSEAAKLVRPYGRDRNFPNDNWKSGMSMGGDMGLATRKKTLGSLYHEFRYQTDDPDSATNVPYGGATGSASVFSEDLVGTAKYGWTKTAWNLKVRNSTIENARGSTQIASVIEETMAFSFNTSFANRQTSFWTDTLSAAEQNKSEWSDGLLGLQHSVSDGLTDAERTAAGGMAGGSDQSAFEILGTVDRSLTANGEDKLRSTVVHGSGLVTAGHIPTTKPTLELCRKVNTIDALGGIKNISPSGGNLVITTAAIWNALADEAEDENTIYLKPREIPKTGVTVGFSLPVIQYGDTYITYDPDCPSGEMYFLSTGAFCYEVQEGNNYRIQDWTNKAKYEEGGDDYSWSKLWLKDRLSLVAPWLTVKATGMASS